MQEFIYNFDRDPYNTHMLVLGEIPDRSKVLEIGAASGYLGEYLIAEKNCEVWGIEPELAAYEVAKKIGYKKMIMSSAEELLSNPELARERFDAILLADVLEHMARPDEVLARLKTFLQPSGRVVISLPNVAHYSVRFGLLAGKWEMADAGILDRTHLRFYTLATASKMIEECGFAIEKVRPSAGYIERFGLNKLWRAGQRALFFWPELLAVQFIFTIKPKF